MSFTPPTRTTRHLARRHDAPTVVVGARCAGAATAMLLARQGHDVVLVDRATFPSDTLSTHAIARGGLVQLARWGLLDTVTDSGPPLIRTITFRSEGGAVTKRVKDSSGIDFLLAPRRHVLDTIMLQAAVDAGARFHSGVSVSGVTRDETGRVVGVTARDADGRHRELRAGFVVGADGVRSRIARAVGAGVVDERPSDGATHYAYAAGLDADGYEFHLGDGRIAGVFPTHGGETNVWVCGPADRTRVASPDREAGFLALVERTAPTLAARLRHAELTSPVRSAVGFPNHVREAAGPGWALVGDAGYHRDPISGHGITDAFRDAELLATQLDRALRGEGSEHDALGCYEAQRRGALGPIFDLTCQLAQLPAPDEFAALQMQLSGLIEAEAAWLASLPVPSASPGLAVDHLAAA